MNSKTEKQCVDPVEFADEKHGVSAVDFFCIGFGAIVGVGWAISINGWMASSGGPVPAALGYLAALIMMIPVALCYCELVPMFPVAGGGMAFSYRAFNDVVALVDGWITFGAFVAIIPWEAIQITDVLGYLIPTIKQGEPLYSLMNSDIYLISIILGVFFSLILFALNMRGLAAAAKVQKILCFVLVGSAIIGAVAALLGGSPSNLEPIYDVTNPNIYGEGLKTVSHSHIIGGILSILATAPFFLAGFETIPQGVEDAGGDISSVGKTVVLSVVLACIFYAFLLFAFGTSWPWQDFALMDSPAASTMFKHLYPSEIPFVGVSVGECLYWFITVGAIAGLFTTWNGFFMASATMLMSMSRGRLLPKFLAKQDAHGIPVNGLLVCLALSMAGPFLGPNLVDSLTCFSSAGFMLSWCINSWSLVRLRYKEPDLHRPYKIPGGIATGYFSGIITTVILAFMMLPITPLFIGKLAVTMFFAWLAVGLILYLCSYKQRKGLTLEEKRADIFAGMEQRQ